ncbi:hypothetical protein ATANTOWER_032212 [Ataeniobius toweri]|uniref:Uncharacterized protein n=1 Tax=Ataeniobius toweri TaxID=208326 RepID=A0ABU7BA74_9TELE|nr:hypothetical protein [Ataeniobius toweri]
MYAKMVLLGKPGIYGANPMKKMLKSPFLQPVVCVLIHPFVVYLQRGQSERKSTLGSIFRKMDSAAEVSKLDKGMSHTVPRQPKPPYSMALWFSSHDCVPIVAAFRAGLISAWTPLVVFIYAAPFATCVLTQIHNS